MNEGALHHPDAEHLAAYVNGLVGAEWTGTAAHLRECSKCREIAVEAAHSNRALLGQRSPKGWLIAVAATLILGAFAAFLSYRYADPISKLQPKTHRLVQGRMSVWNYGPYRVARAAETEQDYRVLVIAAKLHENLRESRSVENLHRDAIAQIALGRTGQAIDLMREAAKQSPRDASLLADLAAAEIADGRIEDGTENAGRSLDVAPTFAPAAFNWALGLELISNKPRAVVAWERYLAIDPVSEWANEARQHLSALKQPSASWDREKMLLRSGIAPATLRRIVKTYPQRVRALVQDELLLKSIESRDFALATSIGRERNGAGDPFILDVVSHAAASDDDPDLLAGVKAFAEGGMAARRRMPAEAFAAFSKASEFLARSKSPLSIEATIYAATHQFYAGQSMEALARLPSNAPLHDSHRYPCMETDLHWLRGLLLVSSGKANEGMREYRIAMKAALRGQEWESQVGLLVVLVNAMDKFGDVEAADTYGRECLAKLNKAGVVPARLCTAYENAAFGSLKWGRPHLALEHARAAFANSSNDPLLMAESTFLSAAAHRELGSHSQAVTEIEIASGYAARIPTPALVECMRSC